MAPRSALLLVYEDVDVKTPKGWRFTARTYVATDRVAPFQRDPRSPR